MQRQALPKGLDGLRALEKQLKEDLVLFRKQNSAAAVVAGIESRIRTVQAAIMSHGKMQPKASLEHKAVAAQPPIHPKRPDIMAAAQALFSR